MDELVLDASCGGKGLPSLGHCKANAVNLDVV